MTDIDKAEVEERFRNLCRAVTLASASGNADATKAAMAMVEGAARAAMVVGVTETELQGWVNDEAAQAIANIKTPVACAELPAAGPGLLPSVDISIVERVIRGYASGAVQASVKGDRQQVGVFVLLGQGASALAGALGVQEVTMQRWIAEERAQVVRATTLPKVMQ